VALTCPAEVTIVVCAIGNVQVLAGGQPGPILEPDEFIHIKHCQPGMIFAPSPGGATFLLISLSPPQTAGRAENPRFHHE
jgi:hypothetical protein